MLYNTVMKNWSAAIVEMNRQKQTILSIKIGGICVTVFIAKYFVFFTIEILDEIYMS